MRPYDEPDPRLLRLQAWLSASLRIGRCFGSEVRMYWLAALLMPPLIWSWFPAIPSALEHLFLTAIAFTGLFGVVLVHEYGHALWARRYGIRTPLITLSPLGGLAHLGAPARGPRQELLVSLAGPATHLLLLAVVWPLSLLLPADAQERGWVFALMPFTLSYLVQLNLGLLLFNLLPFFPMDGGRVLRALLAMRMHPNRATMIATAIGMAGGAAFIVWGIATPGMYGTIRLFLGVANLQACLFERRVARHVLVYGGGDADEREPWQSDPDAWRRGESPFGAEPRAESRTGARSPEGRRGPGLFARLLRRPERAARARREQAQLDAEVDRVLERVQQVGMAGLSSKERKVLDRASRQRRGAG
jgi:Zn-dependent protease